MLKYYGNSHLYTNLEMQRLAALPLNNAAKFFKELNSHTLNPLAYTEIGRNLSAGFELLERMTRRFTKPEFGIDNIEIDNKTYAIEELHPITKTFGRLINFKKNAYKGKKQPKLLIVAPMSGHYATLLRGTVRGLLPHCDVYITDWKNAQEVPVAQGSFNLDDYVDYVMEFIDNIGSGVHVMAVCQPAVPVMAAISIMSAEKHKNTPKSMTLIGGPIDTRKSPTEVNKLAEDKSLEWFRHTVISHVPMNYEGRGRPVYPGFVQLSGFMTMNLEKHIEAHKNLFDHLVENDGESAEAHKKFYNEYLSVMDITAEFYLQTIDIVFKNHALPENTWVSNGRPIRTEKIKNTAILCIEGERDDISGVGQTKAALDLCKNVPATKKKYHLQKGAGHYGIFNGRKYRENIVPIITDFIAKHG